MPPFVPETMIQRSQSILHHDLHGETMMMSIEKGYYYGLNEVGSFIWNLLETPLSFAQLQEKMMEEFEVAPEQCKEDLVLFLQQMAEQQLVTFQAPTPR